jgi:hypothetical protein
MRFTVVWYSVARRRLVNLWMIATNRNEIARAADEIDRRLSQDPVRDGESRDGNRRILCELPLVVQYFVSVPDRIGYVTSVWQPRKRHHP